MKRKHILIGIAGVALVAIIVFVVFLYSSSDKIVKAAIERYGTKITGTKVTVGAVEISASTGRGTIRDVRVANPKGYSGHDAFRLGEITVEIDIASLTKPVVVINEVVIKTPEVIYELNDRGKSNIDAIRDHAESFAPRSVEKSGKAGGAGEKRLRIRSFFFEGGRVEADATAVGAGQTSASLPDLRMTDLGGAGGAPADEIGKKVATTYASTVTKAVAAKGLKRVIDEGAKGLEGTANDLLKKIGE